MGSEVEQGEKLVKRTVGEKVAKKVIDNIAKSRGQGLDRLLAELGIRHVGNRVAYVLASRYWGRGLATEAVAAMLADLGERHGVSSFSAVFKRGNGRSLHLLERLGFSRADEAIREALEVGRDELLMVRPLRGPHR